MMMQNDGKIRDLVIIGGGPAGITAAVYAARKKLDFLIVTKDIGGQAAWSADIENYTGYQFITGPELVSKFREHLSRYDFELREEEEVVDLTKSGGLFLVKTSKGETVRAKTVIIASDKTPKRLGIPGEKEFLQRGVAYCVTCDGPLFAGKRVAVVGGGNSALDAALQLAKYSPEVFLVNLLDKLSGDRVMIDKLSETGKIKVLNSARTVEIYGDKFVSGIKIERAGAIQELPVAGVFVEIGLVPNTAFVDCVAKNDQGEIIVDQLAQTACPGLFAAGDGTNVQEKQVIIAAGDGAKAALAAARYLNTH